MKTDRFILVLCIISTSLVHFGGTFVIETVVVAGAILGYLNKCQFYECCNDDMIPRKTYELKSNMELNLHGQHIAQDIIFSAVHSHVHHRHPKKPLVLSLHGLPGSGKNYVVTMIVKALFKLGEKSKHYHFYNGRNDFPSEKNVDNYRYNLRNGIKQALDTCERSMFVFDEVDKMPAGVLDVLVPFLDYTSWTGREKSKAIFIFLSNTGSREIVDHMISLWVGGKSREEMTIQDFESLIAKGAFNEEGGLHKSGTIESKLIDHHIPFLPMEQKHVIECIKDSFRHWGSRDPDSSQIEQVLKHVTFGPSPHNLYSTSGCKRLDHKVSNVIFQHQLDNW